MGLLFVVVLGVLTAVTTYFFGYASWVLIVLGVLWSAALVVSFFGGHHGFGGGGNTDFMIVIAGVAITAAIIIPKYNMSRPCWQARAELDKLVLAENEYYAKNATYTADINLLKMERNPKVFIHIFRGDMQGFSAATTHDLCLEKNGKDNKYFIWDSVRGGLLP